MVVAEFSCCQMLQFVLQSCWCFQLRVSAMQDELEQAIFGSEQGLMGSLGGDPRDCAVLMSGLPGSVTATLTRRLTLEGITQERILFCDFI